MEQMMEGGEMRGFNRFRKNGKSRYGDEMGMGVWFIR